MERNFIMFCLGVIGKVVIRFRKKILDFKAFAFASEDTAQYEKRPALTV